MRGNFIYLIIEFVKERTFEDVSTLNFDEHSDGNIIKITQGFFFNMYFFFPRPTWVIYKFP